MEKGNVLVIGNSGVGKSTLINAVLGEEVAETSWGTEGTTKELKIYENDAVPFRLIDTVGFEPSFFKEIKAINAVKKWSREAAQNSEGNKKINALWICIDGTARKLFSKTIKDISSATRMWESIPVIVVITKSYSIPEREENIQMVQNAFAKQKISKNLRGIIPVVASIYVLNDNAYAPAAGITELISATNDVMPEGIKAADVDINAYKLYRKHVMAQSVIGVATTAGVVVGAVPIPFADAAILVPVEIGELNALASIYGIAKDERSRTFINSIIEVGTVSTVAKAVLSGIKAIPGVNIAVAVLNSIVAGVFVASIGEASNYLFEQVHLGNKSLEDIDWAKKIVESKLTNETLDKINKAVKKIGKNTDSKGIAKAIKEVFKKK